MSSSVPQRSVVSPIARFPQHLDLFVVGFNGGIYSAWWDQNANNARWNPWFRIGPDWANVPSGSVVTAIARKPDQIDLFVVGHNGGIYSTWWNPNDGWEGNHNWFRIGPDWANVPTNSVVTAVARNPDQIDLFVVGHNGGIYPNIPINNMIASIRQVYEPAGIRVELITTENLNLPALNNLNVGACILGTTTAAQDQLFANRNFAGANDVVVYFIGSTIPALGGCGAHPAGRPGAVVVQGANAWVLAHEVGHVLGLLHPDQGGPLLPNRLMTSGPLGATPPPDLIGSEVATMRNSNLTDSC